MSKACLPFSFLSNTGFATERARGGESASRADGEDDAVVVRLYRQLAREVEQGAEREERGEGGDQVASRQIGDRDQGRQHLQVRVAGAGSAERTIEEGDGKDTHDPAEARRAIRSANLHHARVRSAAEVLVQFGRSAGVLQ